MNPIPPDRIRTLSVAIAAVCLLAASLQIYLHFGSANFPMPVSSDSVHEYAGWIRGEDLWDRLRHNGVASWSSSLGLFLDINVGPYPMWSYAIGYALLAVFIAFFAAVSKPSLGTSLTILFCAVFVLFWFLHFNSRQSYSYIWRIPEVGTQLAAIGSSIFVIRYLDRLGPIALYGLIFLTFVFSSTHAGYAIFIALVLALLFLDRSARHRWSYVAILAAYVLYMTVVDGTFLDLAKRVSRTDESSSSPIELILAVFGLQAQFVSRVLPSNVDEGFVLVLRVLFVALFFGLALHATMSLFRNRDLAAGVFLFMSVSQLIIIGLAVVGRIGAYGMDVIDVPRYGSYSFATLFAMAWYIGVLMRPQGAFIVFASMAVLGLLLAYLTYRYIPSIANSSNNKLSKYYSVVLSGREQAFPEMSRRDQSALLSIAGALENRAAAGFGPGPWSAIERLEPITQVAPQCPGRLQLVSKKSESAYSVWDYRGVPDSADFGFVTSVAGMPIALSREITLRGQGRMRLYVPRENGAIFYMANLGEGEGAPPKILCQLSLADAK